MERKAEHDIAQKLKVLNHAKEHGNISKTCRYFGICRETFYTWQRAYASVGNDALFNNKPCPENYKPRAPRLIEDKIVYLQSTYHFGPDMIAWHLQRYHDIKVSRNGCYQVLKRNKLNRLPENIKKRSRIKFTRFDKKVPGHHVQVDVKFLFLKDDDGQRIKRFQYTAIDDCTRVRTLKVYRASGATHIKPATPRINGKVERSLLSDKHEFYQMLDYYGNAYIRQQLGQ